MLTVFIILVLGLIYSSAVLTLGFALGCIYTQNKTNPTEVKPIATEHSPNKKAAESRAWTIGAWSVLAVQDPKKWEKLKERMVWAPPETNHPFEEANIAIGDYAAVSKEAGNPPPTIAEIMQVIKK